MLSLILAILCSTLISVVMRFSTRTRPQNFVTVATNYLVCALIAGCYVGPARLLPQGDIRLTLALGACSGLLYLMALVAMQVNFAINGVVLSTIFNKLSMLVTLVMAICLFGEQPGITQVAGFVLAVASVVMINLEKGGTAIKSRLGLILLLLISGLCGSTSKIFREIGNPAQSDHFLMFIFLFALLFASIMLIRKKEKLNLTDIFYGVMIGVPNYFSSRFQLKALDTLPAVVVYPTTCVASILLITLAGVVIFRERLSRRQWGAMGVILVALVLLNI